MRKSGKLGLAGLILLAAGCAGNYNAQSPQIEPEEISRTPGLIYLSKEELEEEAKSDKQETPTKETKPLEVQLDDESLKSEIENIIKNTKWGGDSPYRDPAEDASLKIGEYGERARDICMKYLREGTLNERKSAAAGLNSLTPKQNQHHYQAILEAYKGEKDDWLRSYIGTVLYKTFVINKENCLAALSDNDKTVVYLGISASSLLLESPEIRERIKSLLNGDFGHHHERKYLERAIEILESTNEN